MELKDCKVGLIGGGRGGIKIEPSLRALAEKYRVNKMICRKCYAIILDLRKSSKMHLECINKYL